MQNLQEIFARIQKTKKKQKDIRGAYKDALMNSAEYQDISEKIKNLRDKKKQIESAVRSDFSSEFTKLEDMKVDLESDYVLLSDIAMSKLMKGETVEVEDEYQNKYEPIFSVKFKKA